MSNVKLLNYEEDLKIDPEVLDLELIDQPRMFMEYASIYAQALKELSEIKEALEVARAEMWEKGTLVLTASMDKKPTVNDIQSYITQSEEMEKAEKALREAKYRADLAQAATKAMDMRKTSLENLVRLHGQQYFAGPKIPRDIAKAYRQRRAEKDNQAADKTREGLSKKNSQRKRRNK